MKSVKVKAHNRKSSRETIAYLKRRISHADINGEDYYDSVVKEIHNSNLTKKQKNSLMNDLTTITAWNFGDYD